MAPKLPRPKAAIVAMAVFIDVLFKQAAARGTLSIGAYDARRPQQSPVFADMFLWMDSLERIIEASQTGIILWDVLNKAVVDVLEKTPTYDPNLKCKTHTTLTSAESISTGIKTMLYQLRRFRLQAQRLSQAEKKVSAEDFQRLSAVVAKIEVPPPAELANPAEADYVAADVEAIVTTPRRLQIHISIASSVDSDPWPEVMPTPSPKQTLESEALRAPILPAHKGKKKLVKKPACFKQSCCCPVQSDRNRRPPWVEF